MKKTIFKIGVLPTILLVLILSAVMGLNSSFYSTKKYSEFQDSLKTENNFDVFINKDQAIKFSITDYSLFYDKNNPYFKSNDTISILTRDLKYLFNDSEYLTLNGNLIENKKLTVPEELNLYNAKSNSSELKSLMHFMISNLNDNNSWWRYFIFNGGDQYKSTKDKNEKYLDIKMMGIFHELIKNSITREIIYQSIKQNYGLFNDQITVFEKRLMLEELRNLVDFCKNYNVNRKKYLNGRTSVSEKPGDYDFSAEYGYESRNEGFLFRRIELDGIPPSELGQFLKEFQNVISESLNSSDYSSNMSCEINEGRLKVNSHVNQKNKIGFLLRTTINNESYFIPGDNMKVTKLEIKGKEYWRITFDNGKGFVTLNENLKKL
jgi:hypothetical protein